MRMASDNADMPSQRAGSDVPAGEVAEMALHAWQGLAKRLTPIVGERGFRVLYARSLYLTQAAFPCLSPPAAPPDATEPIFASLRQSLERHPTLAADANRALLLTFTGLLNSLIGEVLTARLVQEAPSDGSTDGRSQESSK
jgi:hypothetical protein